MTSLDAKPHSANLSRAHALYERDLTCQSLGITIDEVEPGRASLRMRVNSTMVNGHGTVHGGYLFLLADAAFAYASNAYGPVAVAQSAHVTFLRPAAVNDILLAQAQEVARYGFHGIYDVTVSQLDGPVIAEFRGQSVVVAGGRGGADG